MVKIGGSILDNNHYLRNTLESFADLHEPKILVHGGGKTASKILEKFGITPKVIAGRRITDADTLQVVQMVYGGLLNKNIVLKLQSMGCNAIGMTGADANCILAKKREVREIDYGFAGDIVQVNSTIFQQLLNLDLTPVLSALTHDGKDQMLNTNADTIAADVGSSMAKYFKVNLIYCFDKKGVIQKENDENLVIENINRKSYQNLIKNKKISDGMIPKLHTAFMALEGGVQNVHIIHHEALKNVAEGKIQGTHITL